MHGIHFVTDDKGHKVAVRSISHSMASCGKTSTTPSPRTSDATSRASRRCGRAAPHPGRQVAWLTIPAHHEPIGSQRTPKHSRTPSSSAFAKRFAHCPSTLASPARRSCRAGRSTGFASGTTGFSTPSTTASTLSTSPASANAATSTGELSLASPNQPHSVILSEGWVGSEGAKDPPHKSWCRSTVSAESSPPRTHPPLAQDDSNFGLVRRARSFLRSGSATAL